MKRGFGYPEAAAFSRMAGQKKDLGKQEVPEVFYAYSVGH